MLFMSRWWAARQIKKGFVMATIVCMQRTRQGAMVQNIYTYYTTNINGTHSSGTIAAVKDTKMLQKMWTNANKVKAKHCSNTFLHNGCSQGITEKTLLKWHNPSRHYRMLKEKNMSQLNFPNPIYFILLPLALRSDMSRGDTWCFPKYCILKKIHLKFGV